LGLGSVAVGTWIPQHKGLLSLAALFFMALSLIGALREKKKTGSNTGLVLFGTALLLTLLLLFRAYPQFASL